VPFQRETLDSLLNLATEGARKLMGRQAEILGDKLADLRLPPLGE
jgi:hypothetical protein